MTICEAPKKDYGRCKMYRGVLMFVTFAVLLFGVHVPDAAEIHLKDGRYIEVEHCWEKDSEIVFKLRDQGRLFSIEKELVKEIIGQDKRPGEQAAN
jgi:hypothetical protein